MIVEKGIEADQKAIIKIEHGVYKGFGYIPTSLLNNGVDQAEEFIRTYPDNRDVRQIIQAYLRKHPKPLLLPY
jgi:DNA polymerase-3 subunit epsilon